MKRLLAILMALLLVMAPCAQAAHYGWAFVIYDLAMAIEIDDSFVRTDDETLAGTNSFERSGNVKPDLILEVYDPDSRSQLFVYCAAASPYENLDELTRAYAEDLGAIDGQPDENGTVWRILADQEFMGKPCERILSSFQNVNAEYILMLSEDHSAYIITLITFDGQPPESGLKGITFGAYASASPDSVPDEPQPTSVAQGVIGAITGG